MYAGYQYVENRNRLSTAADDSIENESLSAFCLNQTETEYYAFNQDRGLVKLALETNTVKQSFNYRNLPISAFTMSSDEQIAIVAYRNGDVVKWVQSANGFQQQKLKHLNDVISSLAVSIRHNLLALGASSGKITVLKLDSGDLQSEFHNGDFSVRGLKFVPGTESLLTCDSGGRIQLWNSRSGKQIQTYSGHTQLVVSMAMTADGQRFATGSMDGTARLWDLKSGREIWKLKSADFQSGVTSVALTDNGSKLAVAGYSNGSISVWDVSSRRRMGTLMTESGSVKQLIFSRGSSSKLFYLTYRGPVQSWDFQGSINESKDPSIESLAEFATIRSKNDE
ncbi:MAG: hypothetical protein Tsb009_23610 [Planctomycetaceae bacterium]